MTGLYHYQEVGNVKEGIGRKNGENGQHDD
jgi:hypothetical protein